MIHAISLTPLPLGRAVGRFFNGFDTVTQAYFGTPLLSLQMFVCDHSGYLGSSPRTHPAFHAHFEESRARQNALEQLAFR